MAPIRSVSCACADPWRARARMTRIVGTPRRQRTNIESGLDFVPENDSTASQVVGRHLDGDTIALEHANAKPTHVAAERREHIVSVGQLHSKCRIGQHFGYLPFKLYWFFLGHEPSWRSEQKR